ncbi:ERI1 exoribonuclease 2-like [Styela clava]
MSAAPLTTKELARKLGSVKTTSNLKISTSSPSKQGQPLNYLVVLDFEATCWDSTTKAPGKHEIIEFPAVILDVESGKLVAEFQQYVRPTENPVLSDFCTELTGITKEQVQSSQTIHHCLRDFDRWMKESLKKFESCEFYDHANFKHRTSVQNGCSMSTKLAAFVTWSDWDLGQCLQNECVRKKILKPRELNSWIDLRHFYRNFYKRNPSNLQDALENVGLKFEGRAHSGIVDAQNTARLAAVMMKDGCVLRITRNIQSDGRRVHSVPPPSSMSAILDRMRNTEEKGKRKHVESEAIDPKKFRNGQLKGS